jgi:hypothetical protein
MSTSLSKNFSWKHLRGSGCNLPQNSNQSAIFFTGIAVTPAGPLHHYYYKIHEYWLIIKVFPAALTLHPGSELLVRIKNGCFLPFTTGDSRLGRPIQSLLLLGF